MSNNDTSWIQVGAEVIVWRDRHTGSLVARKDTIVKLNPKSFRVDGDEYRYPIESAPSVLEGYTSHHVAPVDSEKGREILRRVAMLKRTAAVDSAVDGWHQARRKQDGETVTPALEQAAEKLREVLERFLAGQR
jgi:hypothetical protein